MAELVHDREARACRWLRGNAHGLQIVLVRRGALFAHVGAALRRQLASAIVGAPAEAARGRDRRLRANVVGR